MSRKWTALLGRFDYGNDGSRRIMSGDPMEEGYCRVATIDTVAPRIARGKNATPYDAPDKERDEIALLVAAAPELLEALQLLLEEEDKGTVTNADWANARAAVAKALGEV